MASLVVFRQFPVGNTDFFGNRLERVTAAGNDVKVLVVDADGVLVCCP